MNKIKVTSKCELYDGMSITFKAPCDGSAVDGLNVYYNNQMQSFSFRDAHVNDLAGQENLFSEGAYIKAILDTRNGYAYLQNADTNSYIETDFKNTFFTKDETLTDATKTLYQLNAAATPNDVFAKLRMPLNTYGFAVTAVLADGTKIPGLALNGLLDFSDNVAVTDENGKCLCYSESVTPTVTTSDYIGVADTETTIEAQDGYVFTPVTITFEGESELHLIRTSKTINVIPGIPVDMCIVGGGAGGRLATTTKISNAGGGGGYAKNILGVVLENHEVEVVIGAGGAANAGGGSSSVMYDDVTEAVDGAPNHTGNGSGAGDSAGTPGTVRVFDDETLPLPGGGGGASCTKQYPLSGGADFGGVGGQLYSTHYYAAGGGTGPGGGGGGGYTTSYSTPSKTAAAAPGAAGGLYIRVNHRSEVGT